MTQEEMDALMAEGIDESEEVLDESSEQDKNLNGKVEIDMDNFRVDADTNWPPPPPTNDHKVVEQLDDVTRDSETKATEIFEKLETVSDNLMNIETDANEVMENIDYNMTLFKNLSEKFPNINSFKEAIEKNSLMKEKIDNIIAESQNGSDEIMMIMDIMQYQDIHRQKIERVVNVMRALSRYMNSLFDATVDDSKRVSSAVHLEGDSTEDVVSNDDIEALIASLGK